MVKSGRIGVGRLSFLIVSRYLESMYQRGLPTVEYRKMSQIET